MGILNIYKKPTQIQINKQQGNEHIVLADSKSQYQQKGKNINTSSYVFSFSNTQKFINKLMGAKTEKISRETHIIVAKINKMIPQK